MKLTALLEKVMVIYKNSTFILPLTLSQLHPLTFPYPWILNKHLEKNHLGTTPRMKVASCQGLTTPLTSFLFGSGELGFGRNFYTPQESTVVDGAVLCSRILLTAALINSRLMLTVSFSPWSFHGGATGKQMGTQDMGHNPIALLVQFRSRVYSWQIIHAPVYQSAGLAKHAILILLLRTASQRTVIFHNTMQHPFNSCPAVSFSGFTHIKFYRCFTHKSLCISTKSLWNTSLTGLWSDPLTSLTDFPHPPCWPVKGQNTALPTQVHLAFYTPTKM